MRTLYPPQGRGANSKPLRLIKRVTLAVPAESITLDKDATGQAFHLKEAQLVAMFPAGVADVTTGFSSVMCKINDITGANKYTLSNVTATAGFPFSVGNLAGCLFINLIAVANRIVGHAVRQAGYGAAWPGTFASSPVGLQSDTDVAFATINKIILTGVGGTGATENNMHAGTVVELWGVDA
jgi:hypothetical protein